ncbi:aspartyl beta-hydroxylase [Paucibacter sp. KBW04]|nr:aspartyl beta-hydroxylase [Paucibacter sp. KBW04]
MSITQSSASATSSADAVGADFSMAMHALQQGQVARAMAIWQSILKRDPTHLPSLQGLAQQALMTRQFDLAQQSLEELARLDAGNVQPWIQLAMLFRATARPEEEERALFRALCIAPRDLMALLMRASLLERKGLLHEAARCFQAALAVASPADLQSEALRPLLAKARSSSAAYSRAMAEAIDAQMALAAAEFRANDLDRFNLSLDLMLGRKQRYESQPIGYFFPHLVPCEFFERQRFPWLDGIEAMAESIRDEFLAVLGAEQGFTPYLNYSDDQPLDQWLELNKSLRWTAFHLLKDGLPVEENAQRCPQTMASLQLAPQPQQLGRTPVAMFSLLKPRTKIPPHVGVTNARLVTHLPLIIPPDCGFRVGNTTRQWEFGKAWVFDDSIEHEAWNNSDQLRVVLIFDVWHPDLSEVERRMISALAQAQNDFAGVAGGFDL